MRFPPLITRAPAVADRSAPALAAWGAFGRDLGLIALYVPLTLGFFWQFVFLPNTFMPKGGGDLASFLYPVYAFAARSIQQGSYPLWNPYLYAGSPFAADIQSGVQYPINLLTFWLVRPFTYAALEWLAVSHYILAAVFTYLYLRDRGLVRPAAFGGGIVFAFSGFLVAHLGHLNMIEAAVWLPLILLCFHRALERSSILAAIAAGLAYGVSILAGHTQVSLMIGLFLGCFWCWHVALALLGPRRAAGSPAFAAPVRHDRWRGILGAGLVLVVTGLVALGAAAWQIVPAVELVQRSLRADLTYARAAEYAASPLGFITFLVPHFFGRDNLAYWGLKGSLVEVYGYVGLLPLILALVALVRPRASDHWRWFYLAAVGLFLLFSIGEQTPLQGWLYRFIPGFDKVRAPGRFVLLVDFALAVLASSGLHALAGRIDWRNRPVIRRIRRALAVVALLSLPVAGFFYRALLLSQDKDPIIFQRIQIATDSLSLTVALLFASVALIWTWSRHSGRPLIVWIAVALIALDLFAAGSSFNPTDEDVTSGFLHPAVIRFLQSDRSLYRIDSVTNVWDVWQPNTSLLNGIADVMGIYNPMMLADWDRYWANLGSRSGRAYDLTNAKYVIAHKDVQLDWSKFRPVLTDAPKVNVYENTNVLPRALLVPAAEVLPRDEMLTRIRRPDFDPTRTLFLEDATAVQPAAPPDWQHEVVSVEYPSPNEVVIRARTSAPGYLLLTDVYYPGWRAWIDGRETVVQRADFVFRAVALPAGDHTVRFAFWPHRWIIGVVISALTWGGALTLGGWLALQRLRRWTRREAVHVHRLAEEEQGRISVRD